ncbi:MAG TPA: type I restriction endonuclease [Polyangiaceae bacterium]|nr:type I restriction endonuclease [Polyangiaceae bacterium]
MTVLPTTQREANLDRLDSSARPVRATYAILEDLGYSFVSEAELQTERRDGSEAVLFDRLSVAVKRLNPWVNQDTATRAAALFAASEQDIVAANERTHKLLHGVEVDAGARQSAGQERIRFIDFERPELNEFTFAENYRLTMGRSSFTAGTVLFVNGIPLVVIEDEDSSVGGNVAEIIARFYTRSPSSRSALGRLLQSVQILIACHDDEVKYGPVGSGPHRWSAASDLPAFPPRTLRGRLGREPSTREQRLHAFLSKPMLLDVIANFVVSDPAERSDRRRVARVWQFVGVSRMLERIQGARQPAARGGLVCHAHGSGRSLCMLMFVSKLASRRDGKPKRIVVVSDRHDAEDRTAAVLEGRAASMRVRNSAALRSVLAQPGSDDVVLASMRQFRGGTKTALPITESPEIFVVFDDPPRRGHGPELFLQARRALPNACLTTFIGSPMDDKDRLMFRSAGPYVHRYSAADALRHGATIPVVYESRTVPEDSERIVWIARDLVRHFSKHVQPRGFKAQLITRSREDAIAYQQILDRVEGLESAILMSELPGSHPDVSLSRAVQRQRRNIIARFMDAEDPLSILIVCSGAAESAPIHQVSYLDAGPRGHTLVRVLAQPNRALPGKTHARIIDYAKELSRAQRAGAELGPPELEKFLFSDTDVRNLNGQAALAGGSKTNSPN